MRKPNNNLVQWLTNPLASAYFGRAFALKADVLAGVITGANLAEIAKRHGVTRQAATMQAIRARKMLLEGKEN